MAVRMDSASRADKRFISISPVAKGNCNGNEGAHCFVPRAGSGILDHEASFPAPDRADVGGGGIAHVREGGRDIGLDLTGDLGVVEPGTDRCLVETSGDTDGGSPATRLVTDSNAASLVTKPISGGKPAIDSAAMLTVANTKVV